MGSHKSVSRADAHPPGNITDYVEFDEAAAPGTPASGEARLYVKTDGKIYLKDDAGTETDLTAGAGAGTGVLEHISTTNPSAVSSVDITTTAGYVGGLTFRCWLSSSSDDQQLLIQCGDGSVDTGSNYDYALQTGGDLHTDSATDGGTSIGVGSISDNAGFFEILVSPFYDDVNKHTMFLSQAARLRTTTQQTYQTAGRYVVNGAIDVVRFTVATGTITGRIVLYGLGA